MKRRLGLASEYCSESIDQIRASLTTQEEKEEPVVDALEPDAKQKVEDGAVCLIPAQGGCFIVSRKRHRLRLPRYSWLQARIAFPRRAVKPA